MAVDPLRVAEHRSYEGLTIHELEEEVEQDIRNPLSLANLPRFPVLMDEADELALFQRAYQVDNHRPLAFGVMDLEDHKELMDSDPAESEKELSRAHDTGARMLEIVKRAG